MEPIRPIERIEQSFDDQTSQKDLILFAKLIEPISPIEPMRRVFIRPAFNTKVVGKYKPFLDWQNSMRQVNLRYDDLNI